MKIVLGMIVGNEKNVLEKHLPILTSSFDDCIAVESYATDGSYDVLLKNSFKVFRREWNNNYAEARNCLIKNAENMGAEGIIMLDADECMFPADILKVKKILENYDAIRLPRYEFGPTPEYYNPKLYPDFQGRVFRLNSGYHFRNFLHEVLYKETSEKSVFSNSGFFDSKDTHIYHYGRCKSAGEIWLRYQNYNLIKKGEKTINKFPQNINMDCIFKDVVKFEGIQPIKD